MAEILAAFRKDLRQTAKKSDALFLQRFFKTGPGEYGQGDTFIGVRVPQTRQTVKRYWQSLSLTDTLKLLKSKVHEERLAAAFVLVKKFQKASEVEQKKLYQAYLKHARWVNNWDIVDSSAEHIVGAYLMDRDQSILKKLVRSKNIWERRIAIMSTFHFIRNHQFKKTLELSKILLKDPHDLIHKAVGWMLREIGNRHKKTEVEFLKKHYRLMPRTMLRYAIEKFPQIERKKYLQGKI